MINDKKQHAVTINQRLADEYPDAHCALNFSNAFELLVATILSAQCTDERVNIVTAELFRKYQSPQDFLDVETAELAFDIKSITFFNNKAKSIRGASQRIIEEFGGEVPRTIEELITLNGVARKTANVVLGNAYNIASGVVVDTHVTRLSGRLGLTEQTNAEKIERELNEFLPPSDWIMFPHRIIWHGRAVCQARKPKCGACVLENLCPSSLLKVV